MVNEYEKQANDFLARHNIKFHAKFMGDKCPLWCDGKHIHGDRYLVTFTRYNPYKRITLSFWNSLNDKQNGISPNAYDVLASIEKYDIGTFEDFCNEFGYDTDSRKAEKIYKAVKEQYTQLLTLFNDDEMAEMAEIN